MLDEFLFEPPARLHVQAPINRFVRNVHRRLLGIRAHQPAGDLGGRPVRAQLFRPHRAQAGERRQPTALGTLAFAPRPRVRGAGPIVRRAAIALNPDLVGTERAAFEPGLLRTVTASMSLGRLR